MQPIVDFLEASYNRRRLHFQSGAESSVQLAAMVVVQGDCLLGVVVPHDQRLCLIRILEYSFEIRHLITACKLEMLFDLG